MTGADLKSARETSRWTQVEAAHRLGVTQAYLSMVERGARRVSEDLAAAALKVYPLAPTARPLEMHGRIATELFFKESLGELGYPGFAYLRPGAAMNPAELLFRALDQQNLDARVVEALPWLPFRFPDMNWGWLVAEAKLHDRQNRLGFVTVVAMELAQHRKDTGRVDLLAAQIERLERSRLAMEDTLCNASLSQSERTWLRSHRTRSASYWNLLTDLNMEAVAHVA